MNELKNIVIIPFALLCLVVIGCGGTREPDLTGKWYNADHRWGLEFRDGQVFEWEADEIQTEGSFALSRSNGVLVLVVKIEEDDDISFTIEMLDKNSIRMTHSESNEQVELERQ